MIEDANPLNGGQFQKYKFSQTKHKKILGGFMSSSVTQAFVDQFGANVFHLSQQKGSRLRSAVRVESQNGESKFYDRIGNVAAVKKAGRHSNTPQLDTPHSRRMVTLEDYEWADLIDQVDKIKMLNDPASDYVMAAMWAMGRSMDDEIIAASVGSAYSGQKGATVVSHPNSQKYAANDASIFTNLNVRTIRAIKRMMDAQEVEGKRYMAVSALQIEALLGQTEVTSADYNTVKALSQGEVNSFCGFEFIHTERLSTQAAGLSANTSTGAVGAGSSTSGFRKCFAWAQEGILLAIGADMKSEIGPRADKSYSTQAYVSMSVGATRMEEVKVVEILCKES
jgi:hypothetical protein